MMASTFIGMRLCHNWFISSSAVLIGYIYLVIRVPFETYGGISSRLFNFFAAIILQAFLFYFEEINTKMSFYQKYINIHVDF
jgi:hypothetical protein